jgi:DNA topoisomerase VI subunit B
LQQSHVELEVIDTGSGIPESELAHLFTRFHRVRGARARSQEGSGMGLALVRQLVRQLHGSVRVRSTVGLGTTFTVWLPLTQARPPRRAEPADQPDEPDEPGHRVGEHEQAVAGREEASTRRAFAEEAQFWLSGEREV